MPPPESPEADRSSTALALAVAIPAILILAALPFLRFGDGTSIPELSLFLGRFHPTLLHLPVALLLLALAAGGDPPAQAGAPRSQLSGHRPRLRPLAGGAQRLCRRRSPDGSCPTKGATTRSSWTGTSGAASPPRSARSPVCCCGPWPRRGRTAPSCRRLATALVVGTCGTMIFAAHAGGSLTHGEGYLTEHAPAPIRRPGGASHPSRPLRGEAHAHRRSRRPSKAWPCASSRTTAPPATTRASSRAT